MDRVQKLYAAQGAANMTIIDPLIKELRQKIPTISEEDLLFENVNKVIDGFLCPLVNGSESDGWQRP